MSRADKRLRRAQEHDRWLKWTGRRCIVCSRELDDDDLVEWADPREPRTCMDCCAHGETVEVEVPPGQESRLDWILEQNP